MEKAVIIPAILAQTEEEVAQKLLHAKEFAREVQIDIVDGRFATPASWPFAEHDISEDGKVSSLPHTDVLRLEIDLMVDDPEEMLATWMATGATRILFHAESTLAMGAILDRMNKEYGHEKGFMSEALSVGIAVSQATSLELIEPYLSQTDYVQFMGIKRIGVQGQPFSADVLATIRRFKEAHPNMQTQVDGGVTLEVAQQLLELGVSRLVVGSAIWNAENPKEKYREFVELTEQYGIYE